VPAYLCGDAKRLRQVLINLLNNAVKFTEQGEITLTVRRIQEGPAAQPLLCFSVQDTGIGIAPEKIPELFQVFTQVDSSTRRRYEGSGLGLVISRQLVELMGGQIGVESVDGSGSTFWFTVQIKAATNGDERFLVPAHSITSAEWKEAPASSFSQAPIDKLLMANPEDTMQRRVLVAEDNLTNQKVVAAVLKKLGYQADIVQNGREAVEAFGTQRYDVVLMDVAMPEMDGMEATQQIRQLEEESATHIPIIAMTAHAMSDDRARCLASGMDDYLTKPIRLPDLVKAINQWSQRAA
jgi:CheY-like chemotaxis protein